MKSNAHVRAEKIRWFPFWYIESVKSLDGHVLPSNCEMCEAFRAHLRDRFTCCPDLPVQEFPSFLTDFPPLREAEAACCEGVAIEYEVRDALKQVDFNKSPGLDGLPSEVYLRHPHMFVSILMCIINHSFARGTITGIVTKSVIILLKKRGWHIW